MKKRNVVSVVGFLFLISMFSGCVNVPEELVQFSIYSFDAAPGIINKGESANLSWVVVAANLVSIDNGIGNVALTGHRVVFPTQNTTYILTASNATTTKSASVTIIVNIPSNEPQEPAEISIVLFEVTPSIINLGGVANLSWAVTGATLVSIDQGIGSVALTGQRVIIPMVTTTYTLTASNAFTSKQASVVIYVRSEPTPPPVTPNIACTTDSTTNRITIATADVNIKWDDITITTDPVNTWRLYYNGGTTALPDNSYPNNAAVEVIAGDHIFLAGVGIGNVRVTLRYEPTNSLLGTWTINV
jgi:hypothetical protein